MERTAPLLEAVRRDARGVTAARRRVWTRRALIAGFVCALMYVHYRTMHALAAFSTESFAEVPENRAGGEADASASPPARFSGTSANDSVLNAASACIVR